MKFSFQKLKIPSFVKTILKVAVSVAILVLVVRKIDERLLWELLKTVQPFWLLWAFGWFTGSKILSAYRFKRLLRTEEIQLADQQNLRLYWLGMYYNLLLPGGVSGDGYKIKILKDAYKRPLKGLLAISLIDRFSGIIALLQICLLLVPWIDVLQPYKFLAVAAFILSFAVLWVGYKYSGRNLAPVWKQVTLQSAGVQLAQTIAALGLVFALDQQLFWPGYLFLFLISSVVAMFPFTIGGAGARELTFLYGASFLGLQSEKAVAIGFLFYLISTAVAFYGIVFSFRKIV